MRSTLKIFQGVFLYVILKLYNIQEVRKVVADILTFILSMLVLEIYMFCTISYFDTEGSNLNIKEFWINLSKI